MNEDGEGVVSVDVDACGTLLLLGLAGDGTAFSAGHAVVSSETWK